MRNEHSVLWNKKENSSVYSLKTVLDSLRSRTVILSLISTFPLFFHCCKPLLRSSPNVPFNPLITHLHHPSTIFFIQLPTSSRIKNHATMSPNRSIVNSPLPNLLTSTSTFPTPAATNTFVLITPTVFAPKMGPRPSLAPEIMDLRWMQSMPIRIASNHRLDGLGE